jgi:DNA primase
MLCCPNHQDDTTSLAIFSDHIKCFGCSFAVQKRMEGLAWLLGLPSWREALDVAEDYYAREPTIKQEAKKVRGPTLAEVGIYERMLGDRIQWLLDRGLSRETIRSAGIGHNGAAFTIPIFDSNWNLVSLRFRRDDKYGIEDSNGKKLPKYRGWSGRNDAFLYPSPKFARDRHDYVAVVEGELDALLLWDRGVPAITVTNGAGQQGSILSILDSFFKHVANDPYRRPPIQHLIICGDRDRAGIEAAQKLFDAADYPEVSWLQWPIELGKDITEVLQKGYAFNEIQEQYRQSRLLLANT